MRRSSLTQEKGGTSSNSKKKKQFRRVHRASEEKKEDLEDFSLETFRPREKATKGGFRRGGEGPNLRQVVGVYSLPNLAP